MVYWRKPSCSSYRSLSASNIFSHSSSGGLNMKLYFYQPITEVIPNEDWREDILSSSTESGNNILNSIYFAEFEINSEPECLQFSLVIAIFKELNIPLPLINGLSLVIGSVS